MMLRKHLTSNCKNCAIARDSKFKSVSQEDIEDLSYNKTCSFYKKGTTLFHEGSRPLGVYCMNQGRVKIYKIGQDGKEQIISILKEGDLLGYRSMFSEDLFRVSAETLEDVVACFVPKTDFMKIFETNTEFHTTLIKDISVQVNNLTESVTNLAQKPVRERLADALAMLNDAYRPYGQPVSGEELIEINLTREDLANIVGTATETLIRFLHDFKEEGLIDIKGRKIIVKNKEQLYRLAGLY